MSQENVEIVRRAWDAWGRGDLDGVLAMCTEDLIFGTTHIRDWPEFEYSGHDGFRRFMTEWLEVWDAFEVGVEELIPAPDGRFVYAQARLATPGVTASRPVQASGATLGDARKSRFSIVPTTARFAPGVHPRSRSAVSRHLTLVLPGEESETPRFPRTAFA